MAIQAPPQEDQRCVCTHSIAVHGLHGDPGCSFCNCAHFARPEAPKAEIQLGKYPSEAMQALTQSGTFQNVPKEALMELVKDGHGRMYAPGAYLVRRGDHDQHLHVILQGSVIIESEEGAGQHEAGAGAVAGDIRAFTEDVRYSSIYANDNVLALEVDAGKLRETFHDHPELFMALVQVLGKYSDNTEDVIQATIQAALQQHEADQAEKQRDGLDPKKAMEIAARWRQIKEDDRAAADRAREAAQRAINSQTGRGR